MDETATATRIDEERRINLRQQRATALTAVTLKAIEPFLDQGSDNVRRDAYYALMDLFMQQGVDIVTDHDRALLGLSPRTADGWTMEEIRAMDQLRLNTILPPIFALQRLP